MIRLSPSRDPPIAGLDLCFHRQPADRLTD
jgi:hypothetical protein